MIDEHDVCLLFGVKEFRCTFLKFFKKLILFSNQKSRNISIELYKFPIIKCVEYQTIFKEKGI
jgi:hypothetical protein